MSTTLIVAEPDCGFDPRIARPRKAKDGAKSDVLDAVRTARKTLGRPS